MTTYFKLKGLLSNTKHAGHLNFTNLFHNKTNWKNESFHEINFNVTLDNLFKDQKNSILKITNFLKYNFNTIIPKSEDTHYFGHLRNRMCSKTIIKKFFDSFLFKHIQDFLVNIKAKHSKTLKKFYEYFENKDNKNISEDERLALKNYDRHEHLKLFIISDFIVASHLSDLELTQEEKNTISDLKGYYSLIIKSINFSSDVVELFSSKLFEGIINEIKEFYYLKNKEKSKTKKIKKKLILVSSHDTYISANLWFLGVNGNEFDYSYNDELNLILHLINNELLLEIKYNNKTVVPQFCERDPIYTNFCEFKKYMEWLEKRVHREELLNDFCNEDIEKFPSYSERTSHLNDEF